MWEETGAPENPYGHGETYKLHTDGGPCWKSTLFCHNETILNKMTSLGNLLDSAHTEPLTLSMFVVPEPSGLGLEGVRVHVRGLTLGFSSGVKYI